jgi:hypothetical protein
LTSSNGSPTFTIVEKLVHYNRTTKSEQTELNATNIKQTRMGLVNDVKVVDLVLPGSKLFQHLNIFTSTPHSVDGDVEAVGLIEEIRKLRKR